MLTEAVSRHFFRQCSVAALLHQQFHGENQHVRLILEWVTPQSPWFATMGDGSYGTWTGSTVGWCAKLPWWLRQDSGVEGWGLGSYIAVVYYSLPVSLRVAFPGMCIEPSSCVTGEPAQAALAGPRGSGGGGEPDQGRLQA